MRKIVVILLACLFMGACGEPKLDATNENTLKASTEKIQQSLKGEQRKQFDEAFEGIVGIVTAAQLMNAFSGKALSEKEMFAEMGKRLDKKTAKQIIAEFEQIKKEQLEKEKQEALERITVLEAKKETADNAREELKKIIITNAKFAKDTSNPYMAQPTIKFDMENKTDKTIARFFAKGIIKDPKREVPYFEENFNFEISGGLQKGEKKSMALGPNAFGPWGSANNPKGAVFYVFAVKAEGPGKKVLWDAEFSKEEAEELADLKAKYSN
ncbi:hypothetical protein AAIR98_000631 [Elusimicrobium simillimum]|uniref:DUF6694 family lipoprotein n=1 Tax=Elusimicrobium simillimum TaxID=3143438 RepID=UPI003C6FE5F8